MKPPRPSTTSLVPFNRLEPAALDAVPAQRPWRAFLDRVAPGAFVLSGSGSSFFALFPSHPAAAATLEALRRALPAASLHPRGLWLTRPAPVRPSPARPEAVSEARGRGQVFGISMPRRGEFLRMGNSP